jgi:hypothetical protein
MRVINTSDKRFVGTIHISGREFFINVQNGEGIAELLEEMSDIINKTAIITSHIYGGIDDAKQELCLTILEAITLYSKTSGMTLPTFLNLHIVNKCNDMRQMYKEHNSEDIQIYSNAIELEKRTKCWNEFCKDIMYRVFVDDELITEVAEDVNMTPWGLNIFIRRKLAEARNT